MFIFCVFHAGRDRTARPESRKRLIDAFKYADRAASDSRNPKRGRVLRRGRDSLKLQPRDIRDDLAPERGLHAAADGMHARERKEFALRVCDLAQGVGNALKYRAAEMAVFMDLIHACKNAAGDESSMRMIKMYFFMMYMYNSSLNISLTLMQQLPQI